MIRNKYEGKYTTELPGNERYGQTVELILYKFYNRTIKIHRVKNQIKIEYYDKSLLELAKKESETKSKSQFDAL